MKLVSIRKKSGAQRIICVPDDAIKIKLRALVGQIEAKARKICPDSVLHGFTRGRSPVTNALAHVGHRYSLCFDLTDFFDSVTAARVSGKLSSAEREACLIDPGDGRGARALQGLPTSPAVANLAAADLDRAILKAIDKAKHQAIYTRYADDLTFSFDDLTLRSWLLREIPQIVSRCGFKINPRKTRFQPASYGRRNITGINVDDAGIHAPRKLKRRLRAALHQKHTRQARGLEEFSKLRLPKPIVDPTADQIAVEQRAATQTNEAERLARHWNLGRITIAPDAQGETRDGDYLITRDPAYVLGMSTYTTGWTSCMAQPSGSYRRGVKFWLALSGTSIATLLSDRTATHAGIERRVMRARCLLHRFRDGQTGYDRLYGDTESCAQLRAWLESRGCISVSRVAAGTAVVGNVKRSGKKPYLDSLRSKKMMHKERKVWVIER